MRVTPHLRCRGQRPHREQPATTTRHLGSSIIDNGSTFPTFPPASDPRRGRRRRTPLESGECIGDGKWKLFRLHLCDRFACRKRLGTKTRGSIESTKTLAPLAGILCEQYRNENQLLSWCGGWEKESPAGCACLLLLPQPTRPSLIDDATPSDTNLRDRCTLHRCACPSRRPAPRSQAWPHTQRSAPAKTVATCPRTTCLRGASRPHRSPVRPRLAGHSPSEQCLTAYPN